MYYNKIAPAPRIDIKPTVESVRKSSSQPQNWKRGHNYLTADSFPPHTIEQTTVTSVCVHVWHMQLINWIWTQNTLEFPTYYFRDTNADVIRCNRSFSKSGFCRLKPLSRRGKEPIPCSKMSIYKLKFWKGQNNQNKMINTTNSCFVTEYLYWLGILPAHVFNGLVTMRVRETNQADSWPEYTV